ncbi:MAG TPA: MlaD family protein [Solirubrobacteraceae bacterium]|jgi:virulence factor Mce-like protein
MRTPGGNVLGSRLVLGVVTIMIIGLAVYLSYIAENGLPFLPTYRVNVQVANADELDKNADVRVGGALVGQILTITPEAPSRLWPHPYAQLELALQPSLRPLPTDTHYRIRLASVLGAKYLELIPGHRRARGVPDGGTLTLSSRPGANRERPFVDFDTALRIFGPQIRTPLRSALTEFADALAGRGSDFNDSTYTLARLLGPLQRLLAVFTNPANRFGTLIDGAAATTHALAGVAPTINSLLNHSSVTFHALDRPSLGRTIDQFPGTEAVASRVLARSLPTLASASRLMTELRPSAALIPAAANRLDLILGAATPVFRLVPQLAPALQKAVGSVQALARDPNSIKTFNALGPYDLATVGSSAFIGLGSVLRTVASAQFACNVTGLWLRNFASGLTAGDSTGPFLRVMPVLDISQSTQSAQPSADLHDNFYPRESSSQCQAGNERYTGQQLIGNPPRTSTVVDNTAPPRGALARGRRAGLVP